MRFLAELLYLLNLKGIGKAKINGDFLPWLAYREAARRGDEKNSDCRSDPGRFSPEGEDHDGEPFSLAGEWLRSAGKDPAPEADSAARSEAERILAWLEKNPDVRVCTVFDRDYPLRLKDLENQRPPVIYIRGHAGGQDDGEILSAPLLAVIGARWPSACTWRCGREFAGQLLEQSAMPVISGLARGCDRIGHKAAIQAGLPTIAVLPCGIDRIVPEANLDLAQKILNGCGLLLSEYPPGTEPENFRYVERDRLVAALCSAAVVIDCREKSGTMQTVKAASALGRPVACWLPAAEDIEQPVPENIELPPPEDRETLAEEEYGFAGNRFMIREMGCSSLRDRESIESFLKRIQKPARAEQLSFFSGVAQDSVPDKAPSFPDKSSVRAD